MPGVGLRGSRETVEEKESRGQREARSCTARKQTELPGAREKAACTPAGAKGSEILRLIFDTPLLTRAEWTQKQALPALSRSRHQAGVVRGGRTRKLVPSTRARCPPGEAPRPPPSGWPGQPAALPAPVSRARAQMPAPPRLLQVAKAASLCRSEITSHPAAGGPSYPGCQWGLPIGKWGARLSRGGQQGWADVLGSVVIRGCRPHTCLGERMYLVAVIIKLRSPWSWCHRFLPAVPLQRNRFGCG